MQSRCITEVAFSLLGGANGTHAPASIAGERAGRSSLEANQSRRDRAGHQDFHPRRKRYTLSPTTRNAWDGDKLFTQPKTRRSQLLEPTSRLLGIFPKTNFVSTSPEPTWRTLAEIYPIDRTPPH
jgi:hypothetical protein